MIARPLAFIGRYAMPLLAASVFIGLALPPLAALLRPGLSAMIFFLTTATLLRIEWPAVLRHARRPGRVALVLVWLLLGCPLAMAGIVGVVPIPQGLADGLVLWASGPPLISAPAIAVLLGLDGALALVAMVGATMLMPFTVPPLLLWLIGLQMRIGVGELTLRLAVFVLGAVALSAVIRRLIGVARLERSLMELNGANVLLLVLFGIAIMDGVPATLAERPADVLIYAIGAYAGATLFLAAGSLIFLRLGRVPALTIGVVSGNKNMAIIWANLGAAASPDLMLYFAAVQLPIYTLPLLLRPLVRTVAPARTSNRSLTPAETRQ
jgi:BASS family bile acid:Na+ symporter